MAKVYQIFVEKRGTITNGDIVKAMFPHYDIEVNEQKGYVHIFYENFYTTYPLKWWLTPYGKGKAEWTR